MSTTRTLLEVDLRPLAGSRFQPTGFPDLGPATFDRPDGSGKSVAALLVESAQSMANRLEGTTWDDSRQDQHEVLNGLPYVRVVDPDGQFLSSSRLEAHRLASAYIMEGLVEGMKGESWLEQRFGLVKGRPLDHRTIARSVFALDPLSLVHGVFFARKAWPWQPKVARAVTSFIEAYDVHEAISGGVKRDLVNNTADEGSGAREGYGSVPHHRVEYTAGRIVALFTVDHAQLKSYGLSDAATALLAALADWEIATLLDGGLRLRTACDFTVTGVRQGELPDAAEAARRINEALGDCADELGPTVEVVWAPKTSVKAPKVAAAGKER